MSSVIDKLFAIFLLCLVWGCSSGEPSPSDVETVVLENFETVVSFEDSSLVIPSVIRSGGGSSLFIYDSGNGNVLELSRHGEVINEFGSEGQGPGEFQQVSNIFPFDDHVFIVDFVQQLIHKYERNGDFVSSMVYGPRESVFLPPLPPLPSGMDLSLDGGFRGNLNHQPLVTLDGNLLLSTVQDGQSIYELTDWDGNHLEEIGEIPEASTFELDYDEYRRDVANRRISSLFKPNAFPVNDAANPDEYFLVYSSIPKIAKYNSSGEKLWETETTNTPEINALYDDYYESMDLLLSIGDAISMLRFYTSGVSDQEGNLYLAVFSHGDDPLWIHKFNPHGELVHKYKLILDVEIMPGFAIDFTDDRILVATELVEVRAYSF